MMDGHCWAFPKLRCNTRIYTALSSSYLFEPYLSRCTQDGNPRTGGKEGAAAPVVAAALRISLLHVQERDSSSFRLVVVV